MDQDASPGVALTRAGETFFDPIPEEMRKRILDKNIVRLVKREVGEPSMDAIKSTEDVIKLLVDEEVVLGF